MEHRDQAPGPMEGNEPASDRVRQADVAHPHLREGAEISINDQVCFETGVLQAEIGLGLLQHQPPGPLPAPAGPRDPAEIDERADGRQRDALATVLYGGETNEGATHWWVYRTMSRTVHPPLFKRIEFDANIERRGTRIVIPGVLESTARPIRSPATGAEHRVRIDLPHGIELETAGIGSGTTRTMASVALDLEDTCCHFTLLR